MTAMLDVRAESALDTLAEQIDREHALCEQAVRASLQHAIAAGELLLQAQTRVPRGGFKVWLETETAVGAKMAWEYMRLAHYKDELPTGATQREALGHITGLPPRHKAPAAKVQQAILLRHNGEGLTYEQIAERTGLSEATVRRYLSPGWKRNREASARKGLMVKRRLERREAARKRRWAQDDAVAAAGGEIARIYAVLEQAVFDLHLAIDEGRGRELNSPLGSAVDRIHAAQDCLARALANKAP